MGTRSADGARRLLYEGMAPAWEAQQFQAFASLQQRPDQYTDFLLGRLLEEDLHVSCRPMLPPDVAELNGVTIQGACILQIVDVVNIGANAEHRTEDSKGPTRTLKLCFTDGHQLAFGFEFRWLPHLSVSTLRGTKVVVQNVDLRHGLMLLTPQNCHLLGLSGNELLEQAAKNSVASVVQRPNGAGGAYSAALLTTQLTAAPTRNSPQAAQNRPASAQPPRPPQLPAHLVPPPQTPTTRPPVAMRAPQYQAPPPLQNANPVRPAPTAAKPPAVFVDVVSSDDDCNSDDTDPTVQHLFYSPTTPRLPRADLNTRARKRHRVETSTSGAPPQEPIVIDSDSLASSESVSFSLLTTPPPMAPPARRYDPKQPFQYFNPATRTLAINDSSGTVDVRACLKSVASFQFQTGAYDLQVLIDDCTSVQQVRVDPVFVERLMGVSCGEFVQAMQTRPSVAHKWAAQMQFALMTLEGIMTFRRQPTLTLINCRDFSKESAAALLQRVRASQQQSK